MSAKPETELNLIVFVQTRSSRNGAMHWKVSSPCVERFVTDSSSFSTVDRVGNKISIYRLSRCMNKQFVRIAGINIVHF